jgi:DNA-binding CsgD family transcriptional regulator
MIDIDEKLVDEIYEAAVVPECWPAVLQRVATASGSHAGGLIAATPDRSLRGIATEAYRPTYESFARGESARYDNIRARRAVARRHQGFLRDVDLCTLDELRVDPLYRNFLWPFGLGWTVGTLINIPIADTIIFDFARRIDDGPFDVAQVEILDGYRPHLARAAYMSARLGLERARSMTEAMTALGLPAAVIGGRGEPIVTNPSYDLLSARIEPVMFDKQVTAALFGRGTRDRAVPSSRSFPIVGDDNAPPLVVHVLPVRRSALDIFSGAAAIAVITPLSAPSAPPIEIVSALFDLSAAEARVARAVAEGKRLEDCATDFGVSLETIRKQIKNAMAKTGTHRQIDLVRLLLGASGVAPKS